MMTEIAGCDEKNYSVNSVLNRERVVVASARMVRSHAKAASLLQEGRGKEFRVLQSLFEKAVESGWIAANRELSLSELLTSKN